MKRSEGLVQRRPLSSDLELLERSENYALEDVDDSKDVKLTLTEQVFLLALNERGGYVSFWNDCISTGLRGCILIDLCLRGKIELEHISPRNRSLLTRKVLVKNDVPTGNAIFDEALKNIKFSTEPYAVPEWIDYLTGDNWNLLKLKYRLKNVRNRVAKNLVEKGTLTTDVKDFFIFNIKTYPLLENISKIKLVKSIHDAVLSKWSNDSLRMDKKVLALIFMAHASDVLEEAFSNLNYEDYDLAKTRVTNLLHLDFERQAYRSGNDAVLWAVFYALSKFDHF